MKFQQSLLIVILLFSFPEVPSQSNGIEYQYEKGTLIKVIFANKMDFDINENNPYFLDLPRIPGPSRTYRA